MTDLVEQIRALADGRRTQYEIADLLGVTRKRVGRIMRLHDMPRRHVGAGPGNLNHQFLAGRRVGVDGYVNVTAPPGHPHAKQRTGRTAGQTIAEHRLKMEEILGRFVLPTEVVDHIDGLTLHNSPENLRLFESNGAHLAATISGAGSRAWSAAGLANIGARTDRGREIQRVDTYRLRKKRGDVRLRQILLAALKLGIGSPYLLGTHHHLEKAGIDWSQRSNLLRALGQLESRYAADLAP